MPFGQSLADALMHLVISDVGLLEIEGEQRLRILSVPTLGETTARSRLVSSLSSPLVPTVRDVRNAREVECTSIEIQDIRSSLFVLKFNSDISKFQYSSH